MATARLMEEMTWPEVAAAAKANTPVVLALGSTEQHGPHLPLNTDVLIPVAIAKEASRQLDLIIAPPIHFGAMSLSSSGRFIVNAATTRFCCSHQTLKLLPGRSPR